MNYNGDLDIAIGLSAKSKLWKNTKMSWSKLVDRLTEANHTTETFKDFISANKQEQAKIKDVGGYVGGYLRGGRRKPENVVHRQLLTLDIDFAHPFFWQDFELQFENAALLHGTHKWHPDDPRYRLIMPLSREVSPDEYVAIARWVAGDLDIELFDNTTFETNRLMFWPSTPSDMDYYFELQDGPWLDADEILDSYIDWTDSSLWPTAEKKIQEIRTLATRQEDPENKRGIIGAFCRTYSITESIAKYLSDTYGKTALDNRYTYKKGTAAAGLIVYDDKFAYSHHGTDPISGKLCNAFDLVRIHLFGHLDSDTSRQRSMREMEAVASQDKNVKRTIAGENIQECRYEFGDNLEVDEDEELDLKWAEDMEVDAKGKYLSSAYNLNLIFANDPKLKDVFKHNLFDNKRYICANVPWRRIVGNEVIKNVDYSGIRNYIETVYNIVGNLKVDDALALEFEKKSFHPVREYLSSLRWDGAKRVDTFLVDYMGAEDSLYAREAIRKTLVGAVARIFHPGVKFDLVLTLVGAQGTGKSTMVSRLGKQWFSDTFLTVNGKDAFEQLQGAWLIEMAELSGLRKAEVESIKHFITKQVDTFRPAYARTTETFYRQCVFIGTTNQKSFLRDPSGNRRFMPVDINPEKAKKSIFEIEDEEIDQVWAEAVEMYKAGEVLYLSSKAAREAKKHQESHRELDERKGWIEEYLETLLPRNWKELDIYQRRDYLSSKDQIKENGIIRREKVCVAEVWCECLCQEKTSMDRYKTRELNDVLRAMPDWEESSSTLTFTHYGKQKFYERRLF